MRKTFEAQDWHGALALESDMRMHGVSAGGDPKLCLVPICDRPYRRESPLLGPTDLGEQASKDIATGLNGILADVFTLYLKTKNFHWHMSGPHFRDYETERSTWFLFEAGRHGDPTGQ